VTGVAGGREADGKEAGMETTMVSVWWLLVTFMAGGFSGVLVMALMALAADPGQDGELPPAVVQ
jgi:phage shock protein PspC (stress-responsive transcriptional regulator)